MSVNLQTPIDYLKGVGPNRAELLRSELGIHTYQDLINLFPGTYDVTITDENNCSQTG